MVPGFGGFICNYKPAEIHPVLHYVNPPSKSVSFNINLHSNDGLLINYIAQTGDLTFNKASDLVTNWVDSSEALLRKNETVTLKNIGRLFSDIEGNIQFAPDNSTNYLKTAFALKPITAHPVLRGKEVDFTEKFVQETKKHKTETTGWKIAAAIALLLCIGVLVQMMRMGVEIKPLGLNEASVFSWLTHFSSNNEDALKPLPITVETPVTSEIPTQKPTAAVSYNKATPRVGNSGNQMSPIHGYFIIVGAFSQDKNAELVKHSLQAKLPGTVLFFEKSGGLTRVGYVAGPDEKTASEKLIIAKAENPDVWLLKK